MTPPTTYRIADKTPVFPCWVWDAAANFWWPATSCTTLSDTHWCHSGERPTHDPTAHATPATSAAKGGDIPRTPTDSEMLDCVDKEKHQLWFSGLYGRWIVQGCEQVSGNIGSGGTIRAAIAAAMQKGVRG